MFNLISSFFSKFIRKKKILYLISSFVQKLKANIANLNPSSTFVLKLKSKIVQLIFSFLQKFKTKRINLGSSSTFVLKLKSNILQLIFSFFLKLKVKKRINFLLLPNLFLKSKFKHKVSIIVFLLMLFFLPFLILNSDKTTEEKYQDIKKSQKILDKEISDNNAVKKSIEIAEESIEEQIKEKKKSIIKKPKKEETKNLDLPKKKSNEIEKTPKKAIVKPYVDPSQTIELLHKSLESISNKNTPDYQDLLKSIKKTYNSEKMIKMIIGKEWGNVDQIKREKLISVFEEFITRNTIQRFKKIKRVKFFIDGKKNLGNDLVMVKTLVEVNTTEKFQINYLLNKKKNTWKIFDVLLAGTISEIATKKSDFSSSLKNGGIDNLIKALEKKNSSILN